MDARTVRGFIPVKWTSCVRESRPRIKSTDATFWQTDEGVSERLVHDAHRCEWTEMSVYDLSAETTSVCVGHGSKTTTSPSAMV